MSGPSKELLNLDSIKKEFSSIFTVTYKAEVGISDDVLVERGIQFLEANNVDIVCANWVGESDKGFMTKTNEIFVIRKDHEPLHLTGSKKVIGEKADLIWRSIIIVCIFLILHSILDLNPGPVLLFYPFDTRMYRWNVSMVWDLDTFYFLKELKFSFHVTIFYFVN